MSAYQEIKDLLPSRLYLPDVGHHEGPGLVGFASALPAVCRLAAITVWREIEKTSLSAPLTATLVGNLKEPVPDELLLEGVGVPPVVSEVELESPGLDLKEKIETITIPVKDFETHLT